LRRPGPFQIEAAIQSAHCQRHYTGQVPWRGIVQLYAALDRLGPTVATRVGHAVALVEAGDLAQARQLLDALAPAQVRAYQPYWIARWHLYRRLGQPALAAGALATGIGLTSDQRVRAWLVAQAAAAGTA
jgi:RNA polymerase sigma-70 factor (ECF subfamily)